MGTGRSAVAEKTPKESGLTARKKADAVIRLLRGESLDELNRELRVEAHRLQAWSEESWPAARGTKAKPLQPDDRRLRDGERKIGELTMDNEILRATARTGGLQIHPGSGRGSGGAGGRHRAREHRLGCAALDDLLAREGRDPFRNEEILPRR